MEAGWKEGPLGLSRFASLSWTALEASQGSLGPLVPQPGQKQSSSGQSSLSPLWATHASWAELTGSVQPGELQVHLTNTQAAHHQDWGLPARAF